MARNQPAEMSMPELLALPVSVTIPVAARAMRIGVSKAYYLARSNQFPCPVKKLGAEWRVTRPDLFRYLGLPPDAVAAEQQSGSSPEAA